MFDGYYNAFWFLVIGVIFVALNLWVSSLIRPSDPHAEKLCPMSVVKSRVVRALYVSTRASILLACLPDF